MKLISTPEELRSRVPADADLSHILPDLRPLAVPVKSLLSDPRNARKHNPRNLETVRASIASYSQRKPVVVNSRTMIVTAGNGTLEVFRQAGLEYIAAAFSEDDAVTATGYGLADNRSAELAEWDDDVLGSLLRDMQAEQMDVGMLGWSDEDVALLLSGGGVPAGEGSGGAEGGGDDPAPVDKAAELQNVWQTARGQIWEIPSKTVPGRCHRVMCGDSLDPDVIATVLDGQAPDGVWSDAPYGMFLDADYSSAKSGLNMAGKSLKGGRKYDNVIGDHEDFDPGPIMSKIPDKAEQFWWGADYYAERLHGKNDGAWLVWDKRLEESADRMYGSCFELCWSKQRHKRDMIRIKWAGVFGTEKEQAVVGKTKRVHPTQKPVALFEWCAQKFLPGSGKVWLDPFAGSGISLLGAERLGQIACCVELSEAYVAVILERAKSAGLKPRLI